MAATTLTTDGLLEVDISEMEICDTDELNEAEEKVLRERDTDFLKMKSLALKLPRLKILERPCHTKAKKETSTKQVTNQASGTKRPRAHLDKGTCPKSLRYNVKANIMPDEDFKSDPIAQQQESYLKDSTDFINFIERTKLPKNAILASMDVTSLYTNIPQEEGITTVCKAYEDFYQNHLPIPTKFLRQMLCLILKENSFQFNGRHYLQTHGTAMGTKMAVAFANVFKAKIEKGIISKSKIKPLVWKRYIDDVFCVWHTTEDNIEKFVQRANNYHDTIKFTAEISDSEITFLDTKVYKGERFKRESTLDVQTHYKRTETFQYTDFYSCHPPGVKKGFIKGEALRLLRTNSSVVTFNINMQNFKHA
ncbi:uncharacterized protein [Montipora foliosa]|uniref:uncharacterized protein n=1 Tax=Montipora foliosa TaxID=591990 RepID=UPI0035F19779